MSYNIDSSEYARGKLTITASAARKLKAKYGDDLPEGNFLWEIPDDAEGIQVIENPWWYGGGSGHTYDDILPEILKHTKGAATITFTWEGGDSHTALCVEDGVVSKKKAKVVVDD
jgi:hypothetical protein